MLSQFNNAKAVFIKNDGTCYNITIIIMTWITIDHGPAHDEIFSTIALIEVHFLIS